MLQSDRVMRLGCKCHEGQILALSRSFAVEVLMAGELFLVHSPASLSSSTMASRVGRIRRFELYPDLVATVDESPSAFAEGVTY
mmetsp:Transcript_4906/g.13185  ORF Transcript_4906/g.13185 Transcript_4906/m.13185 type:complete len:84 (-) Transcript_4906:258-509(-)